MTHLRGVSRARGFGVIQVIGPDGQVKRRVEFANKITTAGDQHHAKKIAGATTTSPTGMKLGTSTTAASKSGSGAALGTYISGSNITWDATFPSAAAVSGTDVGWAVAYQCTWPAGTATNSAIAEVVIVNDAGTDATSSEANTYSRTVLSAIDKGAGDALVVTWYQTHLGS